MEFSYIFISELDKSGLLREVNEYGKEGYRIVHFAEQEDDPLDFRFFVIMEKKNIRE